MDLIHLQTFVAVADTGGIVNAAARLLRAPSNVSTRIQQLEHELDTELLDRSRRQSSLTQDGITFLAHARNILNLVDEAKEFPRTNSRHTELLLGAVAPTATLDLPTLLADFHVRYPGLKLRLTVNQSAPLIDDLRSGKLTAAFCDGPPPTKSFSARPAFKYDMIIAAPNEIDVSDPRFKESRPTVLCFTGNCSYRTRFNRWLAQENITPGQVIEVDSYSTMLAHTLAGAGICMVPRRILDTVPGTSRIHAYAIQGKTGTAETWLVWNRSISDAQRNQLNDLMSPR